MMSLCTRCFCTLTLYFVFCIEERNGRCGGEFFTYGLAFSLLRLQSFVGLTSITVLIFKILSNMNECLSVVSSDGCRLAVSSMRPCVSFVRRVYVERCSQAQPPGVSESAVIVFARWSELLQPVSSKFVLCGRSLLVLKPTRRRSS